MTQAALAKTEAERAAAEKTKMTSGRIAKWDNIKLFLILCVVIGHLIDDYVAGTGMVKKTYYFIYLFHMPAFVMISGLFSKKAIKGMRYDRAFSFFLLYLLMDILKFAVRVVFTGKTSVDFFHETGIAWYALAICAFYLMTMFLQRFHKGYVLTMAVVIGCMAGYDKNIGSFLSLARILAFYPFFLLGFYLDLEQLLAFLRKRWVKIAAAVIVLAVLLVSMKYIGELYWTIKVLKGKTAYAALARGARYGGILRLIHYIGSTVLSLSVFALIPEKRFPFSVMGQRTLAVYALHGTCITVFGNRLGGIRFLRQLWPEHFNVLLVLAAVVLVAVLSWKPFEVLIRKITVPWPEKESRGEPS